MHLYQLYALCSLQESTWLLGNAKTALNMAGIMISNLLTTGGRSQAAHTLVLLCNEAGELTNLLAERFCTSAPLWVISKELLVGLMQCLSTGWAGRNNIINIVFLKCFNIFLSNLSAGLSVANAQDRLTTAALLHRIYYGTLSILQNLYYIYRAVREDEVHVTAGEICNLISRILWIISVKCFHAVTGRSWSNCWQAAALSHISKEQRQMTCHW